VTLRVAASSGACTLVPRGGPPAEAAWAERFSAHQYLLYLRGRRFHFPFTHSLRHRQLPTPFASRAPCAAARRLVQALRRSFAGTHCGARALFLAKLVLRRSLSAQRRTVSVDLHLRLPPSPSSPMKPWLDAPRNFRCPSQVSTTLSASLPFSLFFAGAVDVFISSLFYFSLMRRSSREGRSGESCL
jgi:hypothetical protein